MDLPKEYKDKINEMLEGIKLPTLRNISKNITRTYQENKGSDNSLVNDELSAKVYAAIRLPATYNAVRDALKHVLEIYKEVIKSLIDVGAGSGAASLAAHSLLDLDSITCLEKEKSMMEIGKSIFLGEKIDDIITYQEFDLVKDDIANKADLVLASYVINELKESERESAIKKMWNATNKVMLIVEPGTPSGYQNIIQIRELILKEGGHIIAPCPHENACPIKKDDWCHFSIRLERDKLHKSLKEGEAPFEDEKYSYIAFSKIEVVRSGKRVLRHPIHHSNFVELNICDSDEPGIIKLGIYKNQKDSFKRAKKIRVGDKF